MHPKPRLEPHRISPYIAAGAMISKMSGSNKVTSLEALDQPNSAKIVSSSH